MRSIATSLYHFFKYCCAHNYKITTRNNHTIFSSDYERISEEALVFAFEKRQIQQRPMPTILDLNMRIEPVFAFMSGCALSARYNSEGAQSLAQGVSRIIEQGMGANLQQLLLNNCNLSENSVSTIVSAIIQHKNLIPQLTIIDFSNNNLSDDFIREQTAKLKREYNQNIEVQANISANNFHHA